MKVFELDAENWRVKDDFYCAIFQILGAPTWHGDAPVALADSMLFWGGDRINALKPPYVIRVKNLNKTTVELKQEVIAAVELNKRVRDDHAREGRLVEALLEIA